MTSPLTRRGPRYAVLVPLTAVIVVVLAAVALLGTRTILFWFKEQTGQGAWHLTYEGTSNDGRGRPAKEVRYGHDDYAEQRYKEERAAPVRLPWRQEAVVDTGNEARVEVVPGTDGVASCRILLDGVRVVAEGTSPAPGKPAVCRVTTPTTPEKWPCGKSVNTAGCGDETHAGARTLGGEDLPVVRGHHIGVGGKGAGGGSFPARPSRTGR
ncbi:MULTISPECIES: hypothetical protein [unclassified Streptomyces]|uniref:Secreted protein n=1 Tax=Streptomyces sp. NBC_00060 TaxID=2975636 RepID=A0AAU2HBZ5_9ACTN